MKRYVAYYRVSTEKQGRSGLGLEAQRTAVRGYNGGRVIAEYTEVESGKNDDRPELAKALAHCRAANATLLVAKLDRLARRVSFISALMESGVDFIACDLPQANRLTVHILAAVAEAEREAIAERTRAAIQARKARGLPWGNTNLPAGDARRAAIARQAHRNAARQRAEDLRPAIEAIQAEGVTTLAEIADELNDRDFPAPRGGTWHANSVRRILAYIALS